MSSRRLPPAAADSEDRRKTRRLCEEEISLLRKAVPFLANKLETPFDMVYSKFNENIPDIIDWSDCKALNDIFQPLKGRNNRQIPLCLLLEFDDDSSKIAIANWWRSLKKEEARAEFDELRGTFYRAPTKSKSPLRAFHMPCKDGARVSTDDNAATLQASGTKVARRADQEQASSQPILLSKPIPFLAGKRINPFDMVYSKSKGNIPDDIGWSDSKALNDIFQPLKGRNNRQIPLCLLLEVEDDDSKIVIANWWRSLKKEEARAEFDELRGRYYRAPTKSKSPLRACLVDSYCSPTTSS